MGSQLDPLPLSRIGSRERASKSQLSATWFCETLKWVSPRDLGAGQFIDKCNMHWNANLKKLDESLRSWYSSWSCKKNEKKPYDSRCKLVRTKMVLKDVGARENGAKTWVVWKYSLACPRIKLRKRCLWVVGSCWGGSIEVKLIAKAWACKKNFSCMFPNYLLESVWIGSTFFYAQ